MTFSLVIVTSYIRLVNPFVPSRLFYPDTLDESIGHVRGAWSIFVMPPPFKMGEGQIVLPLSVRPERPSVPYQNGFRSLSFEKKIVHWIHIFTDS